MTKRQQARVKLAHCQEQCEAMADKWWARTVEADRQRVQKLIVAPHGDGDDGEAMRALAQYGMVMMMIRHINDVPETESR